MPRRQAAEQLDHRLGELVAGPQQVVVQPRLLEHFANVGVLRQVLEVESLAHRRTEKQVLGQGRIAIEARRIEAVDPVLDTVRSEAFAHRIASTQYLRADIAVLAHGNRAPQTKLEQRLLQINYLENLDDAGLELLRP